MYWQDFGHDDTGGDHFAGAKIPPTSVAPEGTDCGHSSCGHGLDSAFLGSRHIVALRSDVVGSHAPVWRPAHAVQRALAVSRTEAPKGTADYAEVIKMF